MAASTSSESGPQEIEEKEEKVTFESLVRVLFYVKYLILWSYII